MGDTGKEITRKILIPEPEPVIEPVPAAEPVPERELEPA
jgi:hypothetical protein